MEPPIRSRRTLPQTVNVSEPPGDSVGNQSRDAQGEYLKPPTGSTPPQTSPQTVKLTEPPSDSVINQSCDVQEENPKQHPGSIPPQIPPQIIDAREPTSAPVELLIQSMALPMNIPSCEQSTVQNQGGEDRHTSVGGGHPPYKTSDLLTLSTGVNPPGSENSVIRGPYFPNLVPHNSNPVLSLGRELTRVSPYQWPPDVLSLQYNQD